jgi:uncharacterized protein
MHRPRQHPVTRRNFLATVGTGVAASALALPAAGQTAPEIRKAPRSTVVSDVGGVKTFLLVYDKGSEIMSGLLEFAAEQQLSGGHLLAIGAVSDAVLAFFDRKKRDYLHIPVAEQAEVTSMTGNIALKDGKPFLHIHTVLGLPDGSTRGGHLLEAHVWPTLEMVVTTWTRKVHRKEDAETGLELLEP